MQVVVQKFGGTSVADAACVKRVAHRAISAKQAGYSVVVVVSAMGKTTNQLVSLAKEMHSEPPHREMDMLLATGEQVSIALLAMAIEAAGHDAVSLTGAQVGLVTDNRHTKASIQHIGTERILAYLESGKIVIVAGFQGISQEDEITTLGRGGSDITAVALAAVLHAESCEIFTDVDGVYTTDPRMVSAARKIDTISYEEMLELASLGAGVLHGRSVEFAKKYEVPLHVRSSFKPDKGTFVIKETQSMEDVVISGLALNKDEAKLTITDVPDSPGMAAVVFKRLATHHINVDMIIQNTSASGKTDISFTVSKADMKKALHISEALLTDIQATRVDVNENIAKVSVVGVGMRRHVGVAAKLFDVLATAGINIGMISTSEIKISCVIALDKAEEAVRLIHEAFGLSEGGAHA